MEAAISVALRIYECAGSTIGIYENRADVGLGIETAALAYGLGFVPLTTECYDLVILEEVWEGEMVQAVVGLLQTQAVKEAIDQLGGYETTRTGAVEWIM